MKAFICSTDLKYHIPDDCEGVTFFFRKEDIIRERPCVSKGCCEIVEVFIDIPNKSKELLIEMIYQDFLYEARK